MFLKGFSGAAALILFATAARADFSYEQTSKITGGMMAGMMKFAGAFSKQAREPIQATVSVKGDRLSTASAHHINIVDLNAETITDVDLDKKTYSVITFAELTRAIQQMSEKMGEKTGEGSLNAKADVKQTGATRTINGFQTKESVLTIEIEGQDNKSGQKGAMTVVTDMWLAPNLPGYEEVRNFYARMGKKLAWTPGMGGMGAMMGRQAGMMKGMSQLSQEASKLEGVPVLQIVRMSGMGGGMSEADAAKMQEAQAQAEQQQQQAPPPSANEAAGSAASGAALGRMGKLGGLAGAAGGFGGFGRKKKQQQEEAPQQQAQTPPPAPAAQTPPPNGMGPTPPGTLMEMTTELTAFSSAPVDVAKLNVPDGFKQVEHEMKKALK